MESNLSNRLYQKVARSVYNCYVFTVWMSPYSSDNWLVCISSKNESVKNCDSPPSLSNHLVQDYAITSNTEEAILIHASFNYFQLRDEKIPSFSINIFRSFSAQKHNVIVKNSTCFLLFPQCVYQKTGQIRLNPTRCFRCLSALSLLILQVVGAEDRMMLNWYNY